MEENLDIKWSAEAEFQLAKIYNYLLTEWGEKEAERFLDLAQEFEKIVSKYPFAFTPSQKKPHLYIGLIHRNVSAIYEVHSTYVLIYTLIDNRADNPKYR